MNRVARTTPEKRINIEGQYKLFVLDGIDDGDNRDETGDKSDITKQFFLRFLLRTQVKSNNVWIVYRDGRFYKQLLPGPHFLFNWNIIWGRWQVHRINLRVVLLEALAEGRVKGPPLPKDSPGAANSDLACDVTAEFRLACKVVDIQKFLSFEQPLSVFYSSFRNLVAEMIGKLPYDQYGEWATTLRDYVKERLQGGKDDSVRLIGMRVEDVFVVDVKANEEHDRNMLEMYKLVERARRELQEAQSNRQRDREVMQSYVEQGNILNIAPSILALQDSAVGQELIGRDAELRKLMIAAGLNLGVNMQPLPDMQGQLGQGSASSVGYLQPPRPSGQLPAGGRQSLLPGYSTTVNSSGPLMPPASSQPLSSAYAPSAGSSGTLPPSVGNPPAAPDYPTVTNTAGLMFPMGTQDKTATQTPPPGEMPISPVRQEQEINELNAAGFLCAGKGQNTPTFDNHGQPIPGSTEWVLEVYIPRPIGYLTLIFHCPTGYPLTQPKVQVRAASGGGLRWDEPNSLRDWHPGRMLVEIAQEIDENTPD